MSIERESKVNLTELGRSRVNKTTDGKFYGIDLHDRHFYMDFSEQFVDFQRVQVKLENGFKKMMWIKIEQTILLPELSDCNTDEQYSFLRCSKVGYI